MISAGQIYLQIFFSFLFRDLILNPLSLHVLRIFLRSFWPTAKDFQIYRLYILLNSEREYVSLTYKMPHNKLLLHRLWYPFCERHWSICAQPVSRELSLKVELGTRLLERKNEKLVDCK